MLRALKEGRPAHRKPTRFEDLAVVLNEFRAHKVQLGEIQDFPQGQPKTLRGRGVSARDYLDARTETLWLR
jgi:hypothetical protein